MGDNQTQSARPLRQLTPEEHAMLDRHTTLGKRGQPRIVIDQQSFDIDNDGNPWGRDRAEWYRHQIAIALARMGQAEAKRCRAARQALAACLPPLRAALRVDVECAAELTPAGPDMATLDDEDRALLAPTLDAIRAAEALIGRPEDGAPAWLDALIDEEGRADG